MKKILLAILLFVPAVTAAEPFIKNPGAANPVPGRTGDYTSASVDDYGRLAVTGGKSTVTVTTALTHEAAAYAAGDCIGTSVSFADVVNTSSLSGSIREVVVSDKAAQGVNLELNCSDIAATDCTDNAAFDPTDAQLPTFMRPIPITVHNAFSDNGVSSSGDINVPFGALASTTLKCFLVSRGAPTYASTTDLSVSITIEKE